MCIHRCNFHGTHTYTYTQHVYPLTITYTQLVTEAKQLLATSPIWSEDEVDEKCTSIVNLIKTPVDLDLSNTDVADYFNVPARFVRALNLLYAGWRSLLSEAAAHHVGFAESGTLETASAQSQRNEMNSGTLSSEQIDRCLQISQNIFDRIFVDNGGSVDQNEHEESETSDSSAPSATTASQMIAFPQQRRKSEKFRQDWQRQQHDEQERMANETALLKRIFNLRLFHQRAKSTAEPSDEVKYVLSCK